MPPFEAFAELTLPIHQVFPAENLLGRTSQPRRWETQRGGDFFSRSSSAVTFPPLTAYAKSFVGEKKKKKKKAPAKKKKKEECA